jgi:transcriptional regulator with XRE-family HTH domain
MPDQAADQCEACSARTEPGRRVRVEFRQARQAALLTLEELAELSGVSVRAISDLERGLTRRPHPRTLRLLAAALGLPAARFADGRLMRSSGSAGVTLPVQPPGIAADPGLPGARVPASQALAATVPATTSAIARTLRLLHDMAPDPSWRLGRRSRLEVGE